MPKGKINYSNVRRPKRQIAGRQIQLDSGWELQIWDALLQCKTNGYLTHVSRTPYGLKRYGSKANDYFTFYQFANEARNKVKGYRPDFLATVTNAEALNRFFGLEEANGDTLFIEGFQIIEPKGRMNVRSRFALQKMRKYYERINVVVLREKHLKNIG